MRIHGSKETFISNVKLVNGTVSVSELNSSTTSFNEAINSIADDVFVDKRSINSDLEKSKAILDLFIQFSPVNIPLSGDTYSQYEQQIRKAVFNSSPVKFVFIALPFKCFMNPLKTNRIVPDLGEVSMFLRMKKISDIVQEMYLPGVVWTILTEGSLYSEIFGIEENIVRIYQDRIRELITILGLENKIMFQELRTVCESNSNFYQTVSVLEKKILEEFEKEDDLPKEYYPILNTMFQSIDIRKLSVEDLFAYQDCMANAKTIRDIREQWPTFVDQAISFTVKYLALNKARTILGNNGNIVSDIFPDYCYVSLTEKSNRLCFKAVSLESKFLPHHGVPVLKSGKVAIVPLIDILCKKNRYHSWYTTDDKEHFPFYYTKK